MKELEGLTRLGNARYLQEKGVDLRNSQADLSTIAAIYRELDNVREKFERNIEDLNAELEAVKEHVPNADR
jgi:hypothetical protein